MKCNSVKQELRIQASVMKKTSQFANYLELRLLSNYLFHTTTLYLMFKLHPICPQYSNVLYN